MAALAARHPCPACHAARTTVRTPWPALAALVDFGWAGVEQDVEPAGLSTHGRMGAREDLFPRVSWAHHVAHTRCARRKAKLRQALEASQTAFDTHVLPQRLPRQALEEWQAWASQRVRAFQRTSSAVEGRNGSLSHMHHNHRGLPKRRDKVWTVLHNFDCRAADGTTPASRFFRRTFPEFFATVLSHLEVFPRSRQRKHDGVLSG